MYDRRSNLRRHRAISEQLHASHGRHGHGHGGLRGSMGSRGPRARRGDVRAAILALLTEKPMHGYEMLKELESRTGGVWRPSAGSIYPTLQLLEDEGLIEGTETEGKRRFALTEAGTKQAGERESTTSPWDDVSAGAPVGRLKLGEALHQLNSAVGQLASAATPDQQERGRAILDETRRSIYGLLSEAGDESSEDSTKG